MATLGERAAPLIAHTGIRTLNAGRAATLRRWFDALPEALKAIVPIRARGHETVNDPSPRAHAPETPRARVEQP